MDDRGHLTRLPEPSSVPAPSRPTEYVRPATLDPEGPHASFDSRRIASFFRLRRWPILGGAAGLMSIIVAFTFLQPKTYSSDATFLVEREGGRADIPALDVLERMGSSASLETEAQLIQSRRVVQGAVDQLSLHVDVITPEGDERPGRVFTDFTVSVYAAPGSYALAATDSGAVEIVDPNSLEVLATGDPGTQVQFAGLTLRLPEIERVSRGPVEINIDRFAEAVKRTQGRIGVSTADRDAEVLRLTCDAPKPIEALELCEALSESYMDMRAELGRVEAKAAAEFLAQQVEVVEEQLAAVEDSLSDYVRRTSSVALDTRASEEVKQNAALWGQREQLVAERTAIASLIQSIEDKEVGSSKYRDLVSFPTFLSQNNGIVSGLLGTIVELETRRADLTLRRSDQDTEVQALNSRIVELEDQIYSIAAGYSAALATQITSLSRTLGNSRSNMASIPRHQVEISRLSRRVELLAEVFGSLQTRLREAEMAQVVELPSVRVIDRASLPFKPTSPNVPLNLILGLMFSLGFGFLLGLWAEYSDTRVRERGILEAVTGIPVLGMIPGLKRPVPVIALRSPAAKGTHAVALAPKKTTERKLALEAFRSLVVDLGFVGRNLGNGGLRSLAVTSSGRGEGKTFTACNLAIAKASHGARVLLVDADLRAGGVSQFLRLPRNLPGLKEILGGEVTLDQAVRVLDVASEDPGGHDLEPSPLFVLPTGASVANSAQLLASPEFQSMLKTASEEYDLVLVDTPPLNVVTDAASVAASVDAVIVVVREGMTEQSALELTLDRLQRAGARPAGLVLNDTELPPHYKAYSYAD